MRLISVGAETIFGKKFYCVGLSRFLDDLGSLHPLCLAVLNPRLTLPRKCPAKTNYKD